MKILNMITSLCEDLAYNISLEEYVIYSHEIFSYSRVIANLWAVMIDERHEKDEKKAMEIERMKKYVKKKSYEQAKAIQAKAKEEKND